MATADSLILSPGRLSQAGRSRAAHWCGWWRAGPDMPWDWRGNVARLL